MPFGRPASRRAVCLLLLALAGLRSSPALQLRLQSQLDALQTPFGTAEGITIRLESSKDVQIAIARLRLTTPKTPPVTDLRLRCSRFTLDRERLTCAGGELSAMTARQRLTARIELAYRFADRGWELALKGAGLDAAKLSAWAQAIASPALEQASGRLQVNLALRGQGATLAAAQVEIDGRGVAFAAGGGNYAGERLNGRVALDWRQDGTLRSELAIASGQAYLDPFFLNLAGKRSLAGTVQIRKGASLEALELRFDGVDISGPQNLDVQGLNGTLAWGSGNKPRRSGFGWRSAKVYRFPIGGGTLELIAQNGALRLAQAARIPLLDGALAIKELQLERSATGAIRWRFAGQLLPVSMSAVSQALGWPPLSGTLAGVIPAVRYDKDQLSVGGALLVKVFGGDITIANLRIAQPFGSQPRLSADVGIFQLDLLELTRTFDFGNIEGRLSGTVRHLELINWQPVRFDAALHTPEGDTSRRRISQRAVENIAALGGNDIVGTLSRGFLGLFQEFRYRQLGIRCRLEKGVCAMAGVGPAPNGGYYLVEGGGLPRIDVIGYNRLVDWDELVARLQAAVRSEGPVVQ